MPIFYLARSCITASDADRSATVVRISAPSKDLTEMPERLSMAARRAMCSVSQGMNEKFAEFGGTAYP
ncbi:hypothetical protein EBN03_31240 [Nocardia stercoris]|uniref:Uncharacterized protein n=1 Tax=Nocardia stercoris TaxID=2483361 RepID=A0A3M2KXD5_9NOCA|nr:hypothetical protein EBN03_31240 [Nocardia stercoris]